MRIAAMHGPAGSRRLDEPAAAERCGTSCMSGSSRVVESATAYGTRASGGSTIATTDDVWLRGNVRPVLTCGAIAVALPALAAAVAAGFGARAAVVASLAAVAALAAAALIPLVRAAAAPRLGRRGDSLLLHLAPWRTEVVPLGLVECVFPGSQPLVGAALATDSDHAADAGPTPTRRVGTLVIRFAERATAWRERPTFGPWGTWRDGQAIVDGRWCAPLTSDEARAISQRLLEAKREASTAGGPR